MAEFNYKYNNYSYNKFSYLKRGSDERQYCAPLFNLPFCTIMRTRFDDFKEYHTSFDNLNYVSSKGLGNSFKMLKLIFIKSTIEPIYQRLRVSRSLINII